MNLLSEFVHIQKNLHDSQFSLKNSHFEIIQVLKNHKVKTDSLYFLKSLFEHTLLNKTNF